MAKLGLESHFVSPTFTSIFTLSGLTPIWLMKKKKVSCRLSLAKNHPTTVSTTYAIKAVYKKAYIVVHKIFLAPTSICLLQANCISRLISGLSLSCV